MGAQQYSFTQMEGSAVYKFAVRTVPHAISEALEKAGVPVDDVKLFVLHQANLRIIASVAKDTLVEISIITITQYCVKLIFNRL